MKKIEIIILVTIICAFSSIFAQNDNDVLFSYADEQVSKSEFEYVFNKNNPSDKSERNEASIQEYLDLYVNFRLKVKEAEEMKLDTSLQFQRELEGYRKQLANSYLYDREITDKLIEEAYGRLQYEVLASHILIKVDANTTDTIKSWNKIQELRGKAEAGEDFGQLARENSEDPSAKKNDGSLGYFSAFRMVYPFESAAFKTGVGEISQPIRTQFGYHIIKVIDKRANQGEIKVSQIFIKSTSEISAEAKKLAEDKANQIYSELKNGTLFSEMVLKESEDPNAKTTNGELPWFSTGRMLPVFETAAFSLKNIGDISMPVKSDYGWHIIKLDDKKSQKTLKESRAELKQKIERDARSQISKDALVDRIQAEYGFTENKNSLKALQIKIAKDISGNNWDRTKLGDLQPAMFTLGKDKYSMNQFVDYILKSRAAFKNPKMEAAEIIEQLYHGYVTQVSMDYEEARLADKHSDFKALYKEYRDGMLLFDLTDKKVWSKAVKDSTGLVAHYASNKNKFKKPRQLEGTIVNISNPKLAKKVHGSLVNGLTLEDVMKLYNTDDQEIVTLSKGNHNRDDRPWLSKVNWTKGVSKLVKQKDKSKSLIVIDQIVEAYTPELIEVRGFVVADYQDKLEKEWVSQLKKKYPVSINETTLKSLF